MSDGEIILSGKPIPRTPHGGYKDLEREVIIWNGETLLWQVENHDVFDALLEAKALLRQAVGGLDPNYGDNTLRNKIWKMLGSRPHDSVDYKTIPREDCVDCRGLGVTREDVEKACPTCRGTGMRPGS